ncbi:MAG TPA: hypothetical protein VF599_24395 [Pyrinomonadaceae bacterium]|jgi:hypothetical protein
MTDKILLKISITLAALLLAAGCGGKSSVTGEVVPIERVCAYEKWKDVAVEGYLAANTMQCKKGKKGAILGCAFLMYSNSDRTGAGFPVYIMTTGSLEGKNNRIENPQQYASDLITRDDDGKPLPKNDLRIYDNDANLIPPESKIRVYGTLPKADRCEFGSANRIDRVS